MRKKAGAVVLVVILVLVGGYVGAKIFLQQKAADEIRLIVDNAAAVENITYSNLAVNPLSMKADMEDVSVFLANENGRIDIGRIELNDWAMERDIPSRVNIRMNGVSLESARHPAKYGRITDADILLAYSADPEAKQLSIDNFMIHAPELGKLDLRCGLANVDLEKMVSAADSPLFFVLVLPGISVASVDIKYQDESLVRRLIDEAATRKGMSRDEYVAFLQRELMGLKEDGTNAYLDNALDELVRFFNHPSQIRIQAAPVKPVPLGQFMFSKDRGMLFEMLKIRVTAKAGA